MTILETIIRLRDDLKTWVSNNLNALNSKVNDKLDAGALSGAINDALTQAKESGEFDGAQADWSQTDTTQADYIKNKPEIPSFEGLATEDYVLENITYQDIYMYPSDFLEITEGQEYFENYGDGFQTLNANKRTGIIYPFLTSCISITYQINNEIITIEDEFMQHYDLQELEVMPDDYVLILQFYDENKTKYGEIKLKPFALCDRRNTYSCYFNPMYGHTDDGDNIAVISGFTTKTVMQDLWTIIPKLEKRIKELENKI